MIIPRGRAVLGEWNAAGRTWKATLFRRLGDRGYGGFGTKFRYAPAGFFESRFHSVGGCSSVDIVHGQHRGEREIWKNIFVYCRADGAPFVEREIFERAIFFDTEAHGFANLLVSESTGNAATYEIGGSGPGIHKS